MQYKYSNSCLDRTILKSVVCWTLSSNKSQDFRSTNRNPAKSILCWAAVWSSLLRFGQHSADTHFAVLYTVPTCTVLASAKVNNHTVFCYIFLLLLYPSIYHWASRDKVGASVGSYHRERRRCAWWPWWSWNIDFFIFKICKIISQFNVWKRVQITVYCILCYSTLLVYTSTVSIYSVPVITNYNNSSPYVRRTTS
jgi:hypothetical protein